ncbi:MAG TPA: hypothetical protein PLG23_10350 [Thermoflexales bacterium]|jgi:hypothetical protein|nr:hypothetical protein [Anaerolineae bacterium]HQV26798.1 hypothetical protein [Thermoflexales bacterium]HQX11091.1 hypothetical protein [Thermoflexales bacterium]HQY26103.1 hypothetical protein [Thermoflexales bacterium]HQZ53856.1 hypothetical protein [Thermoflexales bacterium]
MSNTSVTTMSQVNFKIDQLRTRMQSAHKTALLGETREKAGDLDRSTNTMLKLAAELRERGYAWEKDIEGKCIDARENWAAIRPQAMSAIERETEALRARTSDADWRFNNAIVQATNLDTAAQALAEAEQAVAGLESAAKAADDAIDGMFEKLKADVSALERRMKSTLEQLDLAAKSKIAWLAGESLVRAVKAKWDRDGKDDPNGYLFLSDRRLAFERNEEVATKKTLFIVTEKKRIQDVMLDEPVDRLLDLEPSKRGLMGHEDHLDARYGPGARFPVAHFHIDGQDCKDWQLTLRRMKAGELEASRAVPVSDAEKARIANAPTKCPVCAAPFDAPILRGQTSIKCAYCGTSMPI